MLQLSLAVSIILDFRLTQKKKKIVKDMQGSFQPNLPSKDKWFQIIIILKHLLIEYNIKYSNFRSTKKTNINILDGHIRKTHAKKQFHHTCFFGEDFLNLSESEA